MAFLGGTPEPWPLVRSDSLANDLLAFLHDRLKVHLRDEGLRHDVIDACLAMPGNDDLTLIVVVFFPVVRFMLTDVQVYEQALV